MNIAKVRTVVRNLLLAVMGGIAFWNTSRFLQNVVDLPPRNGEALLVEESRYRGIREALVAAGYNKGPIDFITNRDLKGEPKTDADNVEWGYGQYVMVPWILVRDRHGLEGPPFISDAPWVIGNFFDGEPPEVPGYFVRVFDSGKGVILYRRKPAP